MPPHGRTDPGRRRTQPLGLGEHACLVLVCQGVSHGWAIGTLLAPDGELGRVWSLSRPLTYRCVDALVERGLVQRRPAVAGRGAARTPLRATAAGRRRARQWLAAPVPHIRDIRTELLVKLLLLRRGGQPCGELLQDQLAVLAPAIDALCTAEAAGDPVLLWRREAALAARAFLLAALAADEANRPTVQRPTPRQPR